MRRKEINTVADLKNVLNSFPDDYPDILRADDIANILRISRQSAYELLRSDGFPTLKVGKKRIMVPKEKFLAWIDQNTSA